jgi:hypothetical protein
VRVRHDERGGEVFHGTPRSSPSSQLAMRRRRIGAMGLEILE